MRRMTDASSMSATSRSRPPHGQRNVSIVDDFDGNEED
jgi:hypothetical protein